ncbi:hypothetical protein D915_006014 [Fasciola hepatica]|uniref:Uncharacterized protein n=1 Tax=Fasciola hepatica TaxID=6192 RepID=A0A4E0R8R3_FASHE|nr:hypothetical protein D915_006014 [Fasciola hepatica]
MQRTQRSVDFMNFSSLGPEDQPEYSQSCKTKTGKLLGYVWLNSTDILLVSTDHLEVHQVSPTKRSVRLMKHLNHPTQWYLWEDSARVLVTSSEMTKNSFHLFHFRTPHTITKVCKFEIPSHGNESSAIEPDRCLLLAVYGHLHFVHISNCGTEEEEEPTGTNIHLYRLKMDGSVKLTDVLLLEATGALSINLVDNLILVHHQSEMVTFVYDIAVRGKQSPTKVFIHKPIIQPPQSIAPLFLASKTVPALSSNLDALVPVELYSSNWVVYPPNTVIDGNLGCLWTIKLHNEVATQLIPNRVHAIEFLLNRSNAKEVLLDYCANLSVTSCAEVANNMLCNLSPETCYQFRRDGLSARLDEFASIFKRFGEVFHHSGRKSSVLSRIVSAEPDEGSSDTQMTPRRMSSHEGSFVESYALPYAIEQNDVSTRIFQCSQDNENFHVRSFLYAVLVEFIRALIEHDLEVDNSLQELLVSTIARLDDYTQLTYCIQSRFISDSKPIALQLLSLESMYPAAGQLALDMLKRLNFSNEDVLEVLLLKGKLIEALRFCQMRPHLLRQDRSWAERILTKALESSDNLLLFTVYRFFELLDQRNKESVPFLSDPGMEKFTKALTEAFGTSVLLPPL